MSLGYYQNLKDDTESIRLINLYLQDLDQQCRQYHSYRHFSFDNNLYQQNYSFFSETGGRYQNVECTGWNHNILDQSSLGAGCSRIDFVYNINYKNSKALGIGTGIAPHSTGLKTTWQYQVVKECKL